MSDIEHREALIRWVESALKHEKFGEEAIKSAVKRLKHLNPLPTGEIKESENTRWMNLFSGVDLNTASAVIFHMNNFVLLDSIELEGFYETARILEDHLREDNLDDYIKAAKNTANKSAMKHLSYLAEKQCSDCKDASSPNKYVCIIASSGTGKTQLAVTASLTYDEATTIYLNMGVKGDESQLFYARHQSEEAALLMQHANKFRGILNNVYSPTAIARWASRKDDGTSIFVRVLYHLLTGNKYRKADIESRLLLSDLKKEIIGKTFLVFLDEVPEKKDDNEDIFYAAVCLRNMFRYLGICPILMSTHTGAQHYVATASRDSLEVWTYIISVLPTYSPFPIQEHQASFLKETERPLVLKLVENKQMKNASELIGSVDVIRSKLQKFKPGAWIDGPDLQLVQLFATDVDLSGEVFVSAHKLVGHHFGSLTQQGGQRVRPYSPLEAARFKKSMKVSPVCASKEPLLYLALVTWNESMLAAAAATYFPLIDASKNPLTVRGAFAKTSINFTTAVETVNANANQSDGNLLEVLVHASLTLASMKVAQSNGNKALGIMSLKNFIPLVRMFMVDTYFINLPVVPQQFQDLDVSWPEVPALGSSNSRLPDELAELQNVHIGFLERPQNSEQHDGIIYKRSKKDGMLEDIPLVSVVCKNYADGVSATVLKGIFSRLKGEIAWSIVFVSSLKGGVFAKTKLESLKEECFATRKEGVSILIWNENEDPKYMSVGGKLFKATTKPEIVVIIVVVGHIDLNTSRKRKGEDFFGSNGELF